jgi:sugar phosphate isomerase/epimerase
MKFAYTVATPDTLDGTMLALRGDLETNLRSLAALGYAGVELMVRDVTRLDARAIAKIAGEAGLEIAAISTGPLRKEDNLSLGDEDAERRAEALARTELVVDFAAQFGAQINIGTLRGRNPAVALDSFDRLLRYAGERGVVVSVEPQCKWVANWLNTVDEALAWREQFDPKPSLLFDIYHAALEETSVHAALIRALPAVSMVQVSDSNRGAPGLGQAPLLDFLRVLDALGYRGYVVVECVQRPDGLAAARQSIGFLRNYSI